MKNFLSFPLFVMLVVVFFWGNSLARAEDKKVPEPEAAPSAPKNLEKVAPKGGLEAVSANGVGVLVTPRGSFGLSFSSAAKTCAAFEWAGKGYESKLTYNGFLNNFHYWKVDDWQIVVAVRNTATGGKFDVYFFINGSSTAQFYTQGVLYPAP